MKQISVFFIVLGLFITSCSNDSILNEAPSRDSVEGANTFSSQNYSGQNCFDQISEEHVDSEERIKVEIVYNHIRQNNENIQNFGVPIWNGVVTIHPEEGNDLLYSVNIVPISNDSSLEVTSLFFAEIRNSCYSYMLMQKDHIFNNPYLGIEILTLEEPYFVDDYVQLFNNMQCYVTCESNSIFRGGEPECPKWKKGWFARLFSSVGRFFGRIFGAFAHQAGCPGAIGGSGGGNWGVNSDSDISIPTGSGIYPPVTGGGTPTNPVVIVAQPDLSEILDLCELNIFVDFLSNPDDDIEAPDDVAELCDLYGQIASCTSGFGEGLYIPMLEYHYYNGDLEYIANQICSALEPTEMQHDLYLYYENVILEGIQNISFLCYRQLLNFQETYNIGLANTDIAAIANDNSFCDSTNLEDAAVNVLLQENLSPYYSLFEDLGNFTNEEKLSFIYDELPEINVDDPPNCENCSVGEAQVVWDDELEALSMLECAIMKLDQFNGNTPLDVKSALSTHFGGTSSTLVSSYISFLFEHILRYPYERGYEAENNNEGGCGMNTMAWTYPVVHATDVKLCRPNYWNASDIERSGTLIHEWMHLYYFAGDIAYDWEPDYNDLNTIQQLLNADAFSEFVKEICNN